MAFWNARAMTSPPLTMASGAAWRISGTTVATCSLLVGRPPMIARFLPSIKALCVQLIENARLLVVSGKKAFQGDAIETACLLCVHAERACKGFTTWQE